MLDNIESSKIESLIPRQLIADAGGLIEFLKEYYKFLNENEGPSHILNNVLANRDLDTVVDAFIGLVEKELGAGFTTKFAADKINLYKNLIQFYQAKGSVESFKLLFRLLYDTDIDISFPKEKILIASDGRWVQQTSFFVEITEGNPFDLFANIVQITTPARVISVEVERIKRIDETMYYEIFVTRDNNTGSIVTGATIDEYGVMATVIDSLNIAEVISKGSGFDLAQYTNVVEGSATGTQIKVSSVGDTGTLEDFKFISFGVGYSSEFYGMVIPRADVVGGVDFVVSTDPDADQVTYPNRAMFKFNSSAIAQYPGAYASNNGFLSDDIYLQDNRFYQQFSYLIRSSQQFDNYKNILDKTVHPAGMAAFGAFEINNDFDLSRNLDALRRYFVNRLEDVVDTTDFKKWSLNKPVESTATISENAIYHLTKPRSDIVSISESEIKNFAKSLGDSATVSEEILVQLFIMRYFSDTTTLSDVAVFSYAKDLTEVINSNDSGIIEMLNDVYAENYFAEDYSEGLTSFT